MTLLQSHSRREIPGEIGPYAALQAWAPSPQAFIHPRPSPIWGFPCKQVFISADRREIR